MGLLYVSRSYDPLAALAGEWARPGAAPFLAGLGTSRLLRGCGRAVVAAPAARCGFFFWRGGLSARGGGRPGLH